MAEKIIYRIINLATGETEGVYQRHHHMQFDFPSPADALHANCHGIHKDESKYRIAKIRVTEEEIRD